MNIKQISIVVLVLVLISATGLWGGESPIDKGVYTAGGKIGYTQVSGDLYGKPDDAYQINISLEFQKFFISHLAIGLTGLLDYEKYDGRNRNILGIGPVVSFYLSVQERIYPFIRVSYIFGRRVLDDNAMPKRTASTRQFHGAIGLALFIAKNLALVETLDYVHESMNYDPYMIGNRLRDPTVSYDEVGVSIGLSAFIY